jgi:hypothetical protein
LNGFSEGDMPYKLKSSGFLELGWSLKLVDEAKEKEEVKK